MQKLKPSFDLMLNLLLHRSEQPSQHHASFKTPDETNRITHPRHESTLLSRWTLGAQDMEAAEIPEGSRSREGGREPEVHSAERGGGGNQMPHGARGGGGNRRVVARGGSRSRRFTAHAEVVEAEGVLAGRGSGRDPDGAWWRRCEESKGARRSGGSESPRGHAATQSRRECEDALGDAERRRESEAMRDHAEATLGGGASKCRSAHAQEDARRREPRETRRRMLGKG